jgi:Kef-type K+ transport system membrane component KefB
MHTLVFLRSHALLLPSLAKFSLVMVMLVGVPRMSRWLRLPAVVGLLLSGVLVGPHGLELFSQHAPIADFLRNSASCF